MAQYDQSVDGQRLSGQSGETQSAYHAAYGNDASTHWRDDHNAALGFNGDPNAQYVAQGTKSITDLGIEIKNAGYPGPNWSEAAILTAYANASHVTPYRVGNAPPQSHADSPTTPFNPTSTAGRLPSGTAPGAQTGANIATGLGNFGGSISQPIKAFGLTLPAYVWLGAAGLGAMVLTSGGSRRRR